MAAKKDTPWFRKLADGGLEVFLKAGDYKVRAHGPEADMFELVEWFEEKAGVTVQGDWKRPPRRGPRVPEGQTALAVDEVTEPQPEDPAPAAPWNLASAVREDCSPYGPTVPAAEPDLGSL